MKKLIVDGFELNKDQIEILLSELKNEGVKSIDDLQHYFKDHWHTEDKGRKCHLLVCRHSKKRNFAIPFDE